MLYQLWKEQQMPQRSSMKFVAQKPLRSWKNDNIIGNTRLHLQNGTYAVTVPLFTLGAGNANFWETCFSISPVFWELFLHYQLFPTVSSITEKDTQHFLSLRAATGLSSAHLALLPHILLAPHAREGQLRPANISHVYKKKYPKGLLRNQEAMSFVISSYALGFWGMVFFFSNRF